MLRVTLILFKVKSCNALLRMLLVCYNIYLKSVLRYKFVIFDTCHPDTIMGARMWGSVVIFQSQKGFKCKRFQ